MSIEIKVPQLGESVSEASIGKWYKNIGEAFAVDEPLVELETDKVSVEVPAPKAGVLTEILAKEGDVVEVGALLAKMEEGAAPAKAQAPKAATPEPTPPAPEAPEAKQGEQVLSPAVRRLVEEHNLDPAQIPASGKGGRLLKGDVLAATQSPKVTPQSVASQGSEERVTISRMRKTIAERLKAAQNTAAILTTFNEVDMSHVMGLRNQYKEDFEKKHNVKLGFMSFFVKACIAALHDYPAVNASIEGDEIVYRNYVNMGVAVGTDKGLVVPVIRNVQSLGFAEIEKAIAHFGKNAREGKIALEDLQGGSFTISNGGVYGSMLSTPILNPPQSGVLGMHSITERAMVVEGEIVARPIMYLALSYDHRLIDGKEAVGFLVRVKQCLEHPAQLLLDI